MISQNFCLSIRNYFSNSGTLERDDTAVRHAIFLLILLTCSVGLVGNAIVIITTVLTKKNHKSKIWFLNLAMADFVFLLSVPLECISYLKGSWNFGIHLCKFTIFLYVCNLYASILIIMALNIDRAIAVAKPMWHRKFYYRNVGFWTCTLIWTTTIVASLPYIYSSGEYKINGKTLCLPYNVVLSYVGFSENVTNSSHGIVHLLKSPNPTAVNISDRLDGSGEPQCQGHVCCSNQETLDTLRQIMFIGDCMIILFLVLAYLVPLCVIVSSNIMIALHVQKSPTVHSSRLYRIVIMVVFAYFISWTPLALSYVTFLAAEHTEDVKLIHNIYVHFPVLMCITYLHSCLNPIVYVFVGRKGKSQTRESIRALRLCVWGNGY